MGSKDAVIMSNQLFVNDIIRPVRGCIFSKIDYLVEKCLGKAYNLNFVKMFKQGSGLNGAYLTYEFGYGINIEYGTIVSLRFFLFTETQKKS